MKLFVLKILQFSLLAVILSFPTTSKAASADDESGKLLQKYRIGVIIPLTGPVASLGQYVKNGIELAYLSLPKSAQAQITLSFEDDQFITRQTITAYEDLNSKGKLDAVFVLGSPPAHALASRTEAKKQILIAIGASDPAIVANKNYTFLHWVTPAVLGELLSKEILRRDFKRIAIVTAEQVGALADVAGFEEALKSGEQESRIVFRQSFMESETDFEPAIRRIKLLKADAIVVVLFPSTLPTFLKQAHQLKLEAEIVGMETFEDESVVRASEGLLEGRWYVNAADATGNFTESYMKKFNQHPGWGAANAFDSLKLIAEAISKTKGEPEKTRDFLANVKDYNGSFGKYSSSGDQRFALPAALKRINDGRFVVISQSDG